MPVKIQKLRCTTPVTADVCRVLNVFIRSTINSKIFSDTTHSKWKNEDEKCITNISRVFIFDRLTSRILSTRKNMRNEKNIGHFEKVNVQKLAYR